ncbi:TonB-dependent receptor [Halosquirtibacter xylanolyticus]|uniref:TonB-dependent receptor n=1 Tax=Halosquirtibacter xylanolyticus TaxID=3374599 RepID=UPI003747D499|nr:TonB-dependent receptor [Prolixibacteraceae bacterium]
MRNLFLALILTTLSFSLYAQQTIKGVVVDENQSPIPGAAVAIEGSSKGDVTDFNGNFTLEVKNKGTYAIDVSYMGYNKQVISVKTPQSKTLTIILKPSLQNVDEILVEATRAGEKAPFTYSNISKEVLDQKNTGQDLPYLLNNTPSLVVSSDAGTGIGYTSMKIRGTDQSRINITVDGIPLNDSESQNVFWVNMPDFGSSVQNVQVQRGVGTSTNGAAAFGATVNIQTAAPDTEPYAELNSMAGSFASFKNTVKVGTGLINNHFSFDARASFINSDGYIDRATSDLQSYYVSGGYYSENNIVKMNVFTGKEKTYQAWSGVPNDSLKAGNRTYNPEGVYTDADGKTQYYDNQTDNYVQTHFQLFYTHIFDNKATWNVALHSTLGEGYYESYKDNKKPKKFGITSTSEKMDFITQKWLDNTFYGFTTSFKQPLPFGDFIVGGAWNKYDGDHFGEILWAEKVNVPYEDEWYRGNGTKKDGNIYAKLNANITDQLSVMGDVQYRHVDYVISGTDDNMVNIDQSYNYNFFNPKLGLYLAPSQAWDSYVSFAVAHKEPKRSDFVDAPTNKKPTPERLYDTELGFNYHTKTVQFSTNFYYMQYKDQLVNTGELNDVGSAIMINTPDSYRLGIELSAGARLNKMFDLSGNIAFSQNKIKDFTSYVDDYDADWNYLGQKEESLGTTDIAYSPNVVGNIIATMHATEDLDISWTTQYVGAQFMDNTSSSDRKIDAYSFTNIKASYEPTIRGLKRLMIWGQVNNIFAQEYETNAWVYSSYVGGTRNNDIGWYPQAGINFALGLTIRL